MLLFGFQMAKLKKLSKADKDLISQLQSKIDDQKRELSSRALTILDIQTNVDRCAAVLQQRMDEADTLRTNNATLTAELDSIRTLLYVPRRVLLLCPKKLTPIISVIIFCVLS